MVDIQIRESNKEEVLRAMDESGIDCFLLPANSICYALYILNSNGEVERVTTNFKSAVDALYQPNRHSLDREDRKFLDKMVNLQRMRAGAIALG